MYRVFKIVFVFFLVGFHLVGNAQNEATQFNSEISQLVIQDSIQKAQMRIDARIAQAKLRNDYNALAKVVYWLGKIELTTHPQKSFPRALDVFQEIKLKSRSKEALFHSHLAISKLYNEKGNANKAFEIASIAKSYAVPLNNQEMLTEVLYYLGEYGLRSGNIVTFEENTRKAHQKLQANPEMKFKIAPRVLNYMGALMYLTSKPDSALFYYNQALLKIDVMESNSENQLYFPAAVKANMVLLKQSQNKYEEAMTLAVDCIHLNNKFLRTEKKHPLRYRSQRNLSLAYRNLVSLYEQTGDYAMCERISNLAYNHAKATFEPHLLEYFSAITLLAEAKNLNKDFESAIALCKEAEASLAQMEGENALLKANLFTILGGALYGKKNYAEAAKYYTLGDEFHRQAQEKAFSSDRLFGMMNLALSYAHIEKGHDAIRILENAHTGASESGRLVDAVLYTKAKVGDILKDYAYVETATQDFLDQDTSNAVANMFKAQMIAMNTKAIYFLNDEQNETSLKKLSKQLDKAIRMLEQSKALRINQNDVGSLIQDHENVFDFGKKINLELHQLNPNSNYLKNILTFHESSIYTKIRSRLHLSQNTSSFHIGKEIAQRENYLREKVNAKIDNDTTYLKNIHTWNLFLDSLKISHPKYYEMRYATISIPLANLKEQIPKNTTLIRFLFISERLYAYVADSKLEKLVPLSAENLSRKIDELSDLNQNLSIFSRASNHLYNQLWKPLEPYISTNKLLIFPDRELFNLSFELLSPEEVSSFETLAQQSLMATYSISYNYSLLLLDEKRAPVRYENDFIAFAPAFDKRMKNEYALAISDSIDLDKTYLTLLPQPFISEIAERFSKKYDGTSFLNVKASKQLFTEKAKEHKIIHIGTHAESNNISPELSRLVFAKNVSDSTNINDNYLYTYEIYNQNLNSNLAILTACETGKPTYQPGEGMISLAHAFNYAGSESILTSLWQIDEQSSTEILTFFYNYLEEGLPKDEALRKAKLDYLAVAEGRTLHPQYWAGLILMGDTAPIELSSSGNWFWWLGALALVSVIGLLFYNKKASTG